MAALLADLALPMLSGMVPQLLSSAVMGNGIKRRGRGAPPTPPVMATPYGGKINPYKVAMKAYKIGKKAYHIYRDTPWIKHHVDKAVSHQVNKIKSKALAKGMKASRRGRSYRKSSKTTKKGCAITPGPLP